MILILALVISTNSQQIGIQRGVLIEHPQGLAMPFLQPTGLKANFNEVQRKNAEFIRLTKTGKIGLFHPPANESYIRKFSLDNILFQRDDRIHFVPNTPSPLLSTTPKPPIGYSFLRQQTYHRQNNQELVVSPTTRSTYQSIRNAAPNLSYHIHKSPEIYQTSSQSYRSPYIYKKPSVFFNS